MRVRTESASLPSRPRAGAAEAPPPPTRAPAAHAPVRADVVVAASADATPRAPIVRASNAPSTTPSLRGLVAQAARPVAAVLLGAAALTAPALGAPLEHETSVTTAYTSDTHVRRGQTDALGDLKRPQLVVRRDGWVLGAEAAMITPQRGADRAQFDTGLASVTIGKEGERGGVYATIGQTGGFASELMYDLIDRSHAASGMGPSRKSPASRAPGAFVAVSGRADAELELAALGPATLKLEGAAHGTLGTIKQSVGATALLALESRDARFRPDVPDVPVDASRGTVAYVGLAAEGVARDVVTDRLGTEPLRLDAVAGVKLGLGRSTSIGVEARQPLQPTVRGVDDAPISTVRFTLSTSF